MQIKFAPHKLKAAKAYITKLVEEELPPPQPMKQTEPKPSLFKKIVNFLFK